MEPLFLGSHVAVDFLNTSFEPDGAHIELIGNGKAFLDWLQGAELLNEEQATRLTRKLGAKGLDGAALEARKLRDWARAWLARWRSAPTRDYGAELDTLNKLLAKQAVRREVVRTKDGLTIVEQATLESADDVLALLAGHIAELITQEDPALLKSCAGHGCTLWFLDRTKAHRRLFCSAATCGNRAKVAAFRERRRE
jgi:predicted RNA-binding Zn ribbon-like protein